MSKVDRLFFARTALILRMIDLEQYNKIVAELNKDKGKDSGALLLALGLLDKNQLLEIEKIADSHAFSFSQEGRTYDNNVVGDDLEESGHILGKYSEHYEIRGIVGQGGLGKVFLGFDKNIEREVAIKELMIDSNRPSHQYYLARFIKEAKITGQLEHPGIVPVYELGIKADGSIFYVMKYVKGQTLYQALSACESSSPEESFKKRIRLLDNLIAVCDAMAYAHSNGIIHRDLKPGNIIIGSFGETITIDWGLAKKISCSESNLSNSESSKSFCDFQVDKTQDGKLVGTLYYMSPEQAASKLDEVDQRSDVYSLGIILFMILTGEKPNEGSKDDIVGVLTSDKPSPSPRERSSLVPLELSAICEKAMSKKKEDRFADAGALSHELKAYRDGRLVSVYAYSKGDLFKRFISRNKIMITAAMAVMISIVVGAGLAVNYGIQARAAKIFAENSLVDITSLSQEGFDLARDSVEALDEYFEGLTTELETVAKKMGQIDIKNQEMLAPYLSELQSKHAEVNVFEVIAIPGMITAVSRSYSKEGIGLDVSDKENIKKAFETKNKYLSPIFKTEDGFYAIELGIPIFNRTKMVGMLMSIIETATVIPVALKFDPLKTAFQIWCMQQDGYILYDEDSAQVGKYLFTDQIYSKFPELLNFAEKIRKEPSGIGNYSFFDIKAGHVVQKIAAWDTFSPFSDVDWKIVTTYPYIARTKTK